MTNTTNSESGPFDRVKSINGEIEIAIWQNVNDKGHISYSVSAAQRSYEDKETGQYKTTTTIFDRDTMEVSKLYSQANDRCRMHRETDYRERKAAKGQAA